MKQTSPRAMPPCFERWCSNYDDLWRNIAQKRNLRSYIVGLLGESERKNLTQLSNNMIGVSDDNLHHFITESTWKENEINERRLKVMSKCRQTKPSKKFTLIIDDSGHRKSGALTKGIGIQYIGEIGKTDNGIVMVTSHLYDGVRSLPLDVALSTPQLVRVKKIKR